MGGQGGQLPIQVSADQLTESQPEGVDFASTVLHAHPALSSFLRPCYLLYASFFLKELGIIGNVTIQVPK